MHLLFDGSASDEGNVIKGLMVDFLACGLWLGCLLSMIPSLESFSSSSHVQTEHQLWISFTMWQERNLSLHYQQAGFRIGHFLRYTHAGLNPPMPIPTNLRRCPFTGGLAKFFPGKVPTACQEALWDLEAAEQQVVNNTVAQSCFSGLPPGLRYIRQCQLSLEVSEFELISILEDRFEISQKLGAYWRNHWMKSPGPYFALGGIAVVSSDFTGLRSTTVISFF